MGQSHRTSFALDEASLDAIRRLARRWNVSKAEVVRRAIKQAAERSEGSEVQERLGQYRAGRKVAANEADEYLRQVAEDRAGWRRDS